MNVEHWIIGPQLIGIIMLVAGLSTKCFPPKHINHWYGYRTHSSIQNDDTWAEANCYSSKLMVKIGVILLVSGLVINWLVSISNLDEYIRSGIFIALLLVTSIGSAITIILRTERHLEHTFNKN